MGLGPVLAWFVVLSASLHGCAWSTVGVPIIGAFIIDSDTGGVRGTKFEGRSPEVPDAKRGSP